MAQLGKSFWGDPTYNAKDSEVAHLVEAIRTYTEKQTPTRALQLATSTMHAIAAFVVEKFGPRELLAILDRIRNDVAGLS